MIVIPIDLRGRRAPYCGYAFFEPRRLQETSNHSYLPSIVILTRFASDLSRATSLVWLGLLDDKGAEAFIKQEERGSISMAVNCALSIDPHLLSRSVRREDIVPVHRETIEQGQFNLHIGTPFYGGDSESRCRGTSHLSS